MIMFKHFGVNTVPRGWLFILCAYTFVSCTNTKNVTYFNGIKEGPITSETPIPESVIQRNDILNITVSSLSADASQVFNATGSGGAALNSNGASGEGYLVSSDGYIQFPLLGNVKAEGLTKNQLKEKISNTILEKKLLVDPIVTIRFVNFRITVLGEVKSPGVLTIPSEKVSLLEAIGLAGDMTLYSRRENVMVIREENNQKVIKRLNLNSTDIFSSPYYYLKSNDIVYVEPNKAKVATTNRSNQWLPIFFSGLSLAALLADRIINK
jgi:polysaccharide export outer membrane protein